MADPQVHARRILASFTLAERALLAAQPFAALEVMGIRVRMWPEPEIVGDCSVAGSLDHGPPVTITVMKSASVGRQHFSALHELGHHAIKADSDIHDVFFDEADHGVRLEEQVCDAMAAQLLIPDERVDDHLGGGVTARAVLSLIHASPNSSREACCVRAAARLVGPGHVMVARDGVAQFTASHATPYGVGRGSPQGADHITAKASDRGRCRERAGVVYASGARSSQFFGDAVRDDEGYVVALFVEANPPWIHGLALPPKDAFADAESESYCPHCEADFTTLSAPCPKCRDHKHSPGCDRCSCPTSKEHQLCGECFLRRPPSNFTKDPAICDLCLDG